MSCSKLHIITFQPGALIAFLATWLSTPPSYAHDPLVHVYIVNEAIAYIRENIPALYQFYHETGIDEAITSDYWKPWDSNHQELINGALMADGSLYRFNPLSFEAGNVDHYEDMWVENELFSNPFGDIRTIAGEEIQIWKTAFENIKKHGGRIECFIPESSLERTAANWAECTWNAIFDLAGASIASGIAAFRITFPIGSFVITIVANRFIEGGFSTSIVISGIGGQNFTCFNHLMNLNVEEGQYANNYPGYYPVLDTPVETCLSIPGVANCALATGYVLGDIGSYSINYELSSAARHYKLNGSQLTKDDYETHTLINTQFEPVYNMATYGMNKALENKRLVYLGRSLHAAGDASVPFHVAGQSGGAHADFENFVVDNWEVRHGSWIDPELIEWYVDSICAVDEHECIQSVEKIIVRQGSQAKNRVNGLDYSDQNISNCVCIGVAGCVAILKMYEANYSSKQAASLDRYPFPESLHPISYELKESRLGMTPPPSFDSVGWTWIDERTKSNFEITFSELTGGLGDIDILTLSCLDKQEQFFKRFKLNNLAGASVIIPSSEKCGFRIRYHPPPPSIDTGNDWGFRIVRIESAPGGQ